MKAVNSEVHCFKRPGQQEPNKNMPPAYSGPLLSFFNIYFPLNFLIVAGIGAFAWYQNIPNKWVIPCIVIFYSFVLVPGTIFREIVAYTMLVSYPFVMVMNGYEYSIALSCWYPVLINAFIISLVRKTNAIFIGLCVYHLAGLIFVTVKLVDTSVRFWYLGIITNVTACGILGLTYYLFIKNEQLNGNLQKLLKIIRHDLGNWINLLTLGISLSRKNKDPVHKLIDEGTKNLSDWMHRLKAKIPFNTFAYLEIIPVQNIEILLMKSLGGLVNLTVSVDDALKNKSILTDTGILMNCFMNLVRNAAEAGATAVQISFSADTGKRCAVTVKDNGKGIPGTIAEALFSVQVPTEKAQGSGFGLLGVKYNLDFMDCTIELINANSDGRSETTFAIKGIKTA